MIPYRLFLIVSEMWIFGRTRTAIINALWRLGNGVLVRFKREFRICLISRCLKLIVYNTVLNQKTYNSNSKRKIVSFKLTGIIVMIVHRRYIRFHPYHLRTTCEIPCAYLTGICDGKRVHLNAAYATAYSIFSTLTRLLVEYNSIARHTDSKNEKFIERKTERLCAQLPKNKWNEKHCEEWAKKPNLRNGKE